MKNTTTKAAPNGSARSKDQKETKSKQGSEKDLRALFEDELKDIYWAEKALTKAIPKMIKNASSEELSDALTDHLNVTNEHVNRLEQVFEAIGVKAQAIKCEAMDGLIREAESIMDECEKGPVCDAGIISAGQKVEHYEIATYGTLIAFARTLNEDEAADLLEATLEEEKEADETLTQIAESINEEAAGENKEEEEEDSDVQTAVRSKRK